MQRGLAIYDVLSAARDVGCGSVASTASPGSARGASRSSSPTSRLAISALEAPLRFRAPVPLALGRGSGWLVCHAVGLGEVVASRLCSPLSAQPRCGPGVNAWTLLEGRMSNSGCPSPGVSAPLRPADPADSCRRRPTTIPTPPGLYRRGRRKSPCAGRRRATPRRGVAMTVPFRHSPQGGRAGRSTPVPCQYRPQPPKRVPSQVPCRAAHERRPRLNAITAPAWGCFSATVAHLREGPEQVRNARRPAEVSPDQRLPGRSS